MTGGTAPAPAPAHDAHRAARVRLDAPVRSLKMLELQISAGANEVHLGLRPAAGVPVSFDELPARRDGEATQVTSQAMLRELVHTAHTAGVRVHLCADAPVIPPGQRSAYLDHVARGLDAGVDTVVVGSLAACDWLTAPAQDRYRPALVAGPALGVSTLTYAAMLRDTYGVGRVVLPHTVTLPEVGAFCTLGGLEVEVPVQTGSGLDCARCRLPDLPGIGLGCRAGYEVTAGSHLEAAAIAFLDGASDCALCDVPALVGLGVAALRIAGRESPNLRQNAKITQLYHRVVTGHAAGTPVTQVIESIDRVELMWQMGWVPRLCEQQRCRFRPTGQQRAYV